jgi:hypothetical protein
VTCSSYCSYVTIVIANAFLVQFLLLLYLLFFSVVQSDGKLRVSLTGNPYITFLCHLFWPFIDRYIRNSDAKQQTIESNLIVTFTIVCRPTTMMMISYWVAAVCVVGLVPYGSVTKKQVY